MRTGGNGLVYGVRCSLQPWDPAVWEAVCKSIYLPITLASSEECKLSNETKAHEVYWTATESYLVLDTCRDQGPEDGKLRAYGVDTYS
jgi:hypothetical protein